MHRGNGNISVSQVHDYFPSSNFRIVIVSGSLSSVSFIISLICIRAARLNRNETPDEDAFVSLETLAQVPEPVMKEIISIKISVPSAAAGMMLGNGGEFVRSVCSQSGASIVISDTAVMNERLMHIDGPTAACIVGINMILEQLISDPRYSRYDNYVASYTRLNNFNTFGNHSSFNNNYQNYSHSNYPPATMPYHSASGAYPPVNPTVHLGYEAAAYGSYKRPVNGNHNVNYYQPQSVVPDYRQQASTVPDYRQQASTVPVARPMFANPYQQLPLQQQTIMQHSYRANNDPLSVIKPYNPVAPAPMHNQVASAPLIATISNTPGVEMVSSVTTVSLLLDRRYFSMLTLDFSGEPESESADGKEDGEKKSSTAGNMEPTKRSILHDIMMESNVHITYSCEPNELGAYVFTINGVTKYVDRAVQLILEKCHEINKVQD